MSLFPTMGFQSCPQKPLFESHHHLLSKNQHSEPIVIISIIIDPIDEATTDNAGIEQEPPLPEGPAWTRPFLNYLIHNQLPHDVIEACRITRRSKSFTMINIELYRCNISQVL